MAYLTMTKTTMIKTVTNTAITMATTIAETALDITLDEAGSDKTFSVMFLV